MPRRPPLRRLAATAALLALTACTSAPAAAPAATGPVDVPVPTSRAPAGCARLGPLLPASLGEGVERRPVTGDDTRTAAWGDPAVTLVCGTPAPPKGSEVVQLGPSDQPVMTFAVVDVGAATAFTAEGLGVPVTVTVPDADDATLLVPLVAPLRAALPAG